MKVLQINSVCGIGSTGRIATDIHDILVKQGHESYIAYGRGSSKNCDTTIRIGGKTDNYAHAVLTRLFDKHGFGSKRATKIFIEKVKALDPDIIHLHNIHGYYINIEVLFGYLKEADKPVIWTLHDCWAFTGHCAHFDYVGCNKWRTNCYKCPQKRAYPSSRLLDNSKNNYLKKKEIFTGVKNMTIVTPSEWLANLVKQSFLKEYPVRVINNGIDLEVFKPTESNFRKKYGIEKNFMILGVANIWNGRKGLKYFYDLSKLVDENTYIVLVGLNSKQLENLPKNIIGIKRTNNVKKLVEIYSTADVFVNPTLEDNFPTTNLEALACGTPVITFDTGGSKEILDEYCGFVVQKENIIELIYSIKKIKQQSKLSYLQHSVERAKALYSKKDVFTKYLQLYMR